MTQVTDTHIAVERILRLVPPSVVKARHPADEQLREGVAAHRSAIERVLDGEDPRMLAIIGPCSIHDEEGTYEYAHRLSRLSQELEKRLLVVMRLYVAKPRSTMGWKGLYYDPAFTLNGGDVNTGAELMRRIFIEVAGLGLPIATEVLDPCMPQFVDDIVSWWCIGARTVESQFHRELASGLSAPVGLKNGTDGRLKGAVDAVETANGSHYFWGPAADTGAIALFPSTGNRYAHMVIRGGDQGPNYDQKNVASALQALKRRGLRQSIIIDCAHGNSLVRARNDGWKKDPARQRVVLRDLLDQRKSNTCIQGFMVESNIEPGRQDLPTSGRPLVFGQSITDPCIGWDETEEVLRYAAAELG